MFLGDGKRRTAKAGGVVATTTAGGGNGPSNNGSPSNGARIENISAIAMGADGTKYVASNSAYLWDPKIFTVDPVNGNLATAQSSACNPTNWSDGSPAVGTCIGTQTIYSGMTIARDDSIYFADGAYHNIYKLSPGPNRTISLVAGGSRTTGVCGFSGDGAFAAEGTTKFSYPSGLAVGNDGTLYVADKNNGRIRLIGTDNIVRTVAGNSTPSSCNDTCDSLPTDGQFATTQPFCHPQSLAVGPDGSLYASVYAPSYGNRIVRIGVDGIVKTIAGGGTNGPEKDNISALSANLQNVQGLAFDSAGNLYFFDRGPSIAPLAIRRVDGGGLMTTIVDTAGQTSNDVLTDTAVQDNQLARSTSLFEPSYLSGANLLFGSDGYLYWSELSIYYGSYHSGRVRKVRSLGNLIASEDGSEVYEFDNAGRHLRTRRPLRGGIARDFHYTNDGLVDSITEYAGGTPSVTTIARNTNSITITPPFNSSLQTTIALTNGYATQIAWPTGNVQLTYWTDANNNPNGLLKTLTDPNGNVHNFSYQNAGRLQRDTNPLPNSNGTYLTANRTWKGFNLLKQTPEKQTTLFDVDQTSGTDTTARVLRTVITTDGIDAKTTIDERVDLSKKTTLSNNGGTLSSEEIFQEADYKRFGINSPYWSKIKKSNGGIVGDELNRTHVVALSGAGMFDLSGTEAIKEEVSYASTPTKKWTSIYDATNNKWITTTPTGVQVTRQLDSRERPTTVHFVGSNPSSIADATITYDSQTGRVIGLAQGSRSWTINYGSGTGFVDTIVDNALSRTWSYQRNSLGRPTQETLPGNRSLGFTWDGDGNLTSLTPPKGSSYVHNFLPNPVDLLASYSPPNLGFTPTTGYSYDRDSRVTLMSTPSGTITYSYDYQGRLASRATSAATVTYNYSQATGLLTSVSSTSAPTIQYEYLPGGAAGTLPTKVTFAGMPSGNSPYIEYAYDNRFRLSQRKINGSNVVGYTYDDDGVLSQVTLPTGVTYTINRAVGANGTGVITSTQLSGSSSTVQTFGYNQYAELTSLAVTVGGASKYGLLYNRDAGGRVAGSYPNTVGKDENNYGAWPEYDFTYVYDSRGFLSTSYLTGGATWTSSFDYDNHGNLTGGSCPGCFDLQDRMTSSSQYGLWFNYTGNGEMSYQSNGRSFSYDLLGSLRSTTLNNVTVDYVIDGFDRRIARKTNGTITQQFLYDEGNRIIAEVDGSGNLVSYFVYATHAHVPDVMVRVAAPTGTFVFIHDHLGSPMMIVSSTGTIAQKRAYGPWGDMWYDNTLLGGFTQPFGLAGGVVDDQTGYRFGTRDYNPWLGRWYSKDRARLNGGLNLYAYCNSDPVNCIDPRGFMGAFVWWSLGSEAPALGPYRSGIEWVGVAGIDHAEGGYTGSFVAVGGHIGSESNYGALYSGVEGSVSGVEDILILEGSLGPEEGVVGLSYSFGLYNQGDEWGIFAGPHGGAFGQHGAAGFGVPITGNHGLINGMFAVGKGLWDGFIEGINRSCSIH